ncbi:MAG: PQQ-binding-like beta-propeller repeat protein, partial [Spirochaetales bacterium]
MKTNRIIQKLFLVGAITSLAFVGCDEGQPASRGSADSALASEVGINQDDPEQSRPERARVSLAVEESSLDLSGGLELIETFEPAASIVAAPAIWNNLLLFGTTSGALVSHDLETDAVVYRRKVDGPILSLAVTGTTLVVVTDEQVVAFVPGDGAQLWEYPLDSVPSSRVTLTARSLYLGLANGRVIALDPESGELRWETRVDHALVDRLVVDAGVAYGMGEEGLLYGLDTSTGANVSQWDLGGGGMFVAAPGQADGRLVASGRDGRVVLVSLSENQSVLSTSAGTNGLFTPLALDDQLIVVAGERTLRSLVLPLTQSDADIRWSLELDGQVFGSPFLVGDNII